MVLGASIAVGTLVAVYTLIATERVHRNVATLLGVSILLTSHFVVGTFVPAFQIWELSPEIQAAVDVGDETRAEAYFHAVVEPVDMNVILLLLAMMIVVGEVVHTGIFQLVTLWAIRTSRGKPWAITVVLGTVTAVLSAFLDNVTTILLITPIIIQAAKALRLPVVKMLLPQIFASNIGGAATLVGDPPNILVGSHAGLSFITFLEHLTGVIVVALGAYFLMAYRRHRRDPETRDQVDLAGIMDDLEEEYRIRSPQDARMGVALLIGVVALFLFHSVLDLEVGLAALIGAGFTFGILRADIHRAVERVEWQTIVFLIGLFILIGGVESTHVLDAIGDQVARVSGSNMAVAMVMILWVSAIMSAIVDNIPFTAIMLDVVSRIQEHMILAGIPAEQTLGLWWALVLGADLGGNATLVGASANVVAVGLSERAGHPISFKTFMKEGTPVAFVTCIIGTVALLLFYT